MNKIILMGRTTTAPEYKQTPGGTAVTTFTLAIDRRFKDANGNKITDFIPCVAWKTTAETISKYVGKGQMIAVQGELQSRKYTDKNGNARTAYEVMVTTFDFCEKAQTAPASEQTTADAHQYGFPVPPQTPEAKYEEIEGDDLPF